MILVTTDYITGQELETISIVKGTTIQTVHMGKDLMNSFKTLVGGELTSYMEMIEKARGLATDRMIREAMMLHANAIIDIKYSTSSVMQGAAEIIVYGTAVKFKRS